MTTLNNLVVILFIIGILLDLLSGFYKTINNNKIIGKLLSSASLIQFYSRIFYLISVFFIVFLKEQFNIKLDIFEILTYSIILSLFSFILILKSKTFFIIIYFIPIYLINLIHNFKFDITNSVKFQIKFDKILVLGIIINILIFLALVAPFIIIKYYPNLSMSSVYSSQAINFCSNFILLTFYDPKVNSTLDDGSQYLRGQILTSKLISYVFLMIFLSLL